MSDISSLIHRAMCSHRAVYREKAEGVLQRSEEAGAWDGYYSTLAYLNALGDFEKEAILQYQEKAKPKMPIRVFRNYIVFRLEEARAHAYIDLNGFKEVERLLKIAEEIKEQAEKEDEDYDGMIESLHAADFERNAYGTD